MIYDLKTGNCKYCWQGYHHCGSCGTNIAADDGFCSADCFNDSADAAVAKENAQTLYNSLNTQQRKRFLQFVSYHNSYEFADLFREDN